MPVSLKLANHHQNSWIDPNDRERAWLGSTYHDSMWILRDTGGLGREETVDFNVRMADGKSLIDHPLLYATAKELIFWIRAAPYTNMQTAVSHYGYAKTILRICYGLTARGIYSFGALTAFDIDRVCVEGAMGVDGLVQASKILKEKLAEFQRWDDVPKTLLMPRKLSFDLNAVIEAYNLPTSWVRKEIKSELQVTSARFKGRLLLSFADVKESPVTYSSIQLITNSFDALYVLRPLIKAPSIRFNPFPQGPGKRALELGVESDPTPIAPPGLVMRFLENTVRYVASRCDEVTAAYNEIIAARRSGTWRRPDAECVRPQVNMLAVACFVLISAFTARRTDEIKELQRDCLDGNDLTGHWMRCYINKTQRKLTWIPIPNIVARVVRVLLSFGGDGEKTIFDYVDPVSGDIATLTPERDLNDFAQLVDARKYVPDNDNNNTEENTWWWQNRQFRRFFAVMYIWQYKGKLESLSHHLRHFSLETTKAYVMLDADNVRIWGKEVSSFRIELIKDVATGTTTYGGPMGQHLNALVKRLRAKFSDVNIYPEVMAKAIIRQLDKAAVVITPKAWVSCCCPRNAKGCSKAACKRVSGLVPGDIGPDYTAAGPAVCTNCPWALIGPENVGFIDDELHAMEQSLPDDEIATIFDELQAENVASFRQRRSKLHVA